MPYPTCPICGDPSLIVTALFTTVDATCEACRYQVSVGATDALRAPLHAVLVQGISKLRKDYGLIVPPERSQRWFSTPDPIIPITALEGLLHDAAREGAGGQMFGVDVTTWQRARDDASAEIAVWLSNALYAAMIAATEARALAEVA